MKIISVTPLTIPDVKVIKFARFADERGYFTETIRTRDLRTIPKAPELHDFEFHQINESFSHENVLRGLHFQYEPHMGKLVRAIEGSIIDIALDIRVESETFGKAVLYELSYDKKADSQDWLWVPPGFAHGFIAMSNDTRMEYACTGWWNPQCEFGITVFDKSIDWTTADEQLLKKFKELLQNAIINEKDKGGMTLSAWKQCKDTHKFMSTLPKTKN